MRQYTYNFEISQLIAQFADAFNEVVIKRYDRSTDHNFPTQKGSDIAPTFIYSPKQRTIHDYINNQAKLRLPVICYHITSISRDVSRVFNKIEGPSFTGKERITYNDIGQPVPVDINISLTILSKYQEDLDQILCNFIPYTDPYVVVSWPSPYVDDQEIRSQIQWTGDVSLDYPTDLTHSDPFRIVADTSFVIKGHLFKAEVPNTTKTIHDIFTNFYAVSDIYCNYSQNVANQQPNNTDTWIISGRPTLTNAWPYTHVIGEDTTIAVEGSMFDFTSSYYLSGNMFTDTFHDFTTSTYVSSFFSYNTAVSAYGFYGERIYPEILSENIFTFSVPSITSTGYFDVIAFNDAGLGKLTTDSIILPLTAEEYTPYQKPVTNGINVINSY